MIFLDSVLHIHPQLLHRAIDEALAVRQDQNCLLIYGDCHPHMQETGKRPNCIRVDAINCCDLLLGRDHYKSCRNSKAFLFLPEWTARWREIFQEELGFTDSQLARQFMQENQKKLIYLDTGQTPVPEKTLEEISSFFAMPMEVVTVSLEPLRNAVRTAVQRMEARPADEC